ncbi:MAG: alpha/beta hydrolase [Planctomycetota bacterium]|nr:MAG: alpha/beta hydrolase [Planctomycetota bacterium]
MRSFLLACAFFSLAPLARAQGGCQILLELQDVKYDTAHPQQVLDFFHPTPAAADPAPVIVWLSGGYTGLQPPTPDPCQVAMYSTLLQRGFALVLPDLRPSTAYPFPAQVFDCARAVQTVKQRAVAWNIDPQRVFLMGRSNGGAISASVAYGFDLQGVFGSDPVSMQSSRPAAVYLGSAPSNFFAIDGAFPGTYFGQPTLADVSPNSLMLGSPVWWLTALPGVPVPTYLVYKGAIGTPPLADVHDAWCGLDYGIALLSRGATLGFQYFPSGIDGTNFDAVATWFLTLFP